MKKKNTQATIPSILIIFSFLVIGCGAGNLISKFFVTEYSPSWSMYPIPPLPEQAIDILHVDINQNYDDPDKFFDPSNDVVYVQSESGILYSNTLFQSNWQIVEPEPTWEFDSQKCATDWIKEDLPPVKGIIIDSAGVRIERPTNLILRCFVLLKDGNIQFWEYHISSLGFMGESMVRAIYVFIGGVIGIIMGFIAIFYRKETKRTKDTNSS